MTALAGNETDLWIGTLNRGLLHWRGGQVTRFEGLPDKQVLSIATRSGWGGVCGHRSRHRASCETKPMERVIGDGVFARTLLIDGQRLYVGTLDPGIYEIPLSGGRPHFLETSAAVRGLFAAARAGCLPRRKRVSSRRGSGLPC